MQTIEDIDRLEQIQFRCFLSDYNEKWIGLKPHLDKFIGFEDHLMEVHSFTREAANRYIGDYILNNVEPVTTNDLGARALKVNLISILLGRFSVKEGFDMSESFTHLYKFQEEEKVLLMAIMFGMREELLYF